MRSVKDFRGLFMGVRREKGKGRGGGRSGEEFTWITRRARPNRIDNGFENMDIDIPLTRPVSNLS